MGHDMVDPDLAPETSLFRYISIESFLSVVETERVTLTLVTEWEDTWEAFLSRIPTIDDDGKIKKPLYSFHQELYGQCWSTLHESDAMWRIYSPSKTGLQIKTTVEKFKSIAAIRIYRLGKVTYFDSIDELMNRKEVFPNSPFENALYKRSAFAHEHEVRFLVHGSDLLNSDTKMKKHINLSFKPNAFIEGITIDPRASDWYVDAIVGYCKRAGLGVAPTKSKLYEPEPHMKSGLVRQWVPVDQP